MTTPPVPQPSNDDDNWINDPAWVDIGDNHAYRLAGNNRDGSPHGLIFRHPIEGGMWCESSVMFDTPYNRAKWPRAQQWQVISDNPLTLSPSLQCTVHPDHGFIRNGTWMAV